MKIIILQSTRMGDVLQTSPLLQQVRNRYPDAHITLLVRRMGRVIAERHPAVNEVVVYDEDSLYLDVKSQDSERLLAAYNRADAYVRNLREAQYDIVYNVTHSIASAMLLKLIAAPKTIGADLSDDWQFLLRGRWTRYFFTSVYNREYNDLNLCDITRNFENESTPCRKLVFDLRDEDRAFVDAICAEHGIAPIDFVVCFQLGASEENKRWSESQFAGLARKLAEENHARIFLVGITEEAPLGEKLGQLAPGLTIPLYGKTTIPQLAALLERANVLVTNDTGTMHIAAAVGCRVALVSVGHVHYRETGPYGEGHCAIEYRRKELGRSDYVPGGLEEREALTPDQVAVAVACCLEESDVSFPQRTVGTRDGLAQLAETPELADVDIYRTRFAPDGCLQFYPVIRRELTQRDFVRMAYRTMWLDYLDPTYDTRAERESIDLMLAHFDLPPAPQITSWRKDLESVFDQLAAIAQRGVRITEQLLVILRKKDLAHAKQVVGELVALDEEARVFSEVHPAGRPLILMARFERETLEGADPMRLAETTLNIYRACFQRARSMQKKIAYVAARATQ